jgi:hypothetical protein
LLVHHSENPRAFKGSRKATLPVYFRSNRKAWIIIPLFENWSINCFIPEDEKYCRENYIPFRILLVLDNAPGHPAHLDDFHPDVKVVFLPPDTTSLIQPMNQGVMANFKAYYLRLIIAEALAATNRDTDMTLRDFRKSYSIYEVILNIAKAWQEVTQNCFIPFGKKYAPSLCLVRDL